MTEQTKITREEALGRAVTAATRAGDGRRADESIAYSQLAQAWALIAATMRPNEHYTLPTHDPEAR